MDKTNLYVNGVRGIIFRAKKHNSDIGNYIEHFINEPFPFAVRLSNGRIEIPTEMAHDQETMPSSISEDRIKRIAMSFKNDNPETISKPEMQTPIEQKPIRKLSIWQQLLEFFGYK